MIIKFEKGSNEGAIYKNDPYGEYVAVTAVWSKGGYKTIKGAEKAMNKKGYYRV